jgi:hypothetical protein
VEGYSPSKPRLAREALVCHELRNVKLTKAMKDLVRDYHDSTYSYTTIKKDEKALAGLYVEIQCSLVDDEGKSRQQGERYQRNGISYCCGAPLAKLDNRRYCTRCAKFH